MLILFRRKSVRIAGLSFSFIKGGEWPDIKANVKRRLYKELAPIRFISKINHCCEGVL